MRVADLDRDMRHVIPTGMGVDSEFLYARMTDATLALAGAARGRRILDVASGLGGDAIEMTSRGAEVTGVEPSARILALAREWNGRLPGAAPRWIRAWSDGLPFTDASFDAVVCKGSIDHFERPGRAIAEMARVTRRGGRVVLAIANFESLAFRIRRRLDHVRQAWLRRPLQPGRRVYDVPADHFTRYELALMREQASRFLELEKVVGISLAWGFPGWSRTLERLPAPIARAALQALDALARRRPAWADVVVLAGRPRRSWSTSP